MEYNFDGSCFMKKMLRHMRSGVAKIIKRGSVFVTESAYRSSPTQGSEGRFQRSYRSQRLARREREP